ncbi:hypothetical protein AKJ09_02080 [Labilithrix luteola]|uniref:Uncharacterized protein n=1 Tax=Labilithrix luteola TaxID=1391654 RepID=A0A0K1PPV9_9BACT|nr:hypothetical protein [Labilithrix luteola]AKU95416.1 hypothetical protein AKJ09_02080 [Labilithrix luteola]
MSDGRGFAYGLALGVALGGGALVAILAVKEQLRLRALRREAAGGFIDGVHEADTAIADWTLADEGRSYEHEHLESERVDMPEGSQRW